MWKYTFSLYLLFVGCMNKQSAYIDVQGHRGCRGLMPENTVMAFEKALELGVTTLEMDLCISKDHEIVVSHEPFFSHYISIGPDSLEITEENEKEHNLYSLSLDEIKSYDVGLKIHEWFPAQEKVPAVKPTLAEVVSMTMEYIQTNNVEMPWFNVEIKRRPEWDSIYSPPVDKYVELVCEEVISLGIAEHTTIQSFDVEALKITKRLYPNLKLVYLIQNTESPDKNLETLGFIPEVYSPYFKLIDEELLKLCRDHSMSLIPWTVNEIEDIKNLLDLGVDGIISDYPDRVLSVISSEE